MKKNWWRYPVMAFGLAVGAGITMAVFRLTGVASPAIDGFIVGVYVTVFGALVAYSLTLDSSHWRSMGAEAERWTTAELGKLADWRIIDAVEFSDRDIDHVAVGPATILAVETKWTSRQVRIGLEGVSGSVGDGVGQADRGAKRIQRFLRSRGFEHPVIPLLVLWGPEVPQIEGGYLRIGDVRVVVGKQAPEWRARIADLPRWSRSTNGAYEVLESYVREFDRRHKSSFMSSTLRRLIPTRA